MTKKQETYALQTETVEKIYESDFGTIRAVDGVSLEVKAGEFVALVGPSGSGKTTMLSILAALLQPTSGRVVLDGQDLARMSDKDRVTLRRGLGERLYNLPGQMSGGQQQRVAIARALIHNPSLVLADEPTASLDTERAYQVVKTFAGLIHEQNRAGIMVTHDLRMCEYVDRVLLMQDGQLTRVIDDAKDITNFARGAME